MCFVSFLSSIPRKKKSFILETVRKQEQNTNTEMLQNPKILQSSLKFHPSEFQNIPNSQSFPISKLSRRQLTIFSNSSLILLLSSQTLEPLNLSRSRDEENLADTTKNDQQEAQTSNNSTDCSNKSITKRAFLDISIDGEPAGRIIIGLYGEDAEAGAARFANLVSGAAGISYRRKEFVKIMPNYVQHGGVRSYGVDAELAKRTGSDLEAQTQTLTDEWERQNEMCSSSVKNSVGSVSIVVRDPSKPPPKLKLIARKGKLEIDQEEVGTDPNGTEFAIAIRDSPELDASNLVIGKVLEGMAVAERIQQVKTVQENTSSPYFRVAKLIGDKRAVVAERGFNRPYSKVIITNCGLME